MGKDIIETSINKGLLFLREHQFPNGEFAVYISGDAAMTSWIRPESATFPTALICHSLFFINAPLSLEIQALSLGFLGGQIDNGLWNHFTKYHIYRSVMPLDADSTSIISALYRDREMQWPAPSNIPLLLANRNNQGLFYTWFTIRVKWISNKKYWYVVLRQLLRPFKSLLFWIKTEASRIDVDSVVNANVLYYLGDIPETQQVIFQIIKIIEENREENCDAWYLDAMVVYYFFSRNYFAGIKKLEPIKIPIIKRILAKANPNGMIGSSITDTALGVSCLINFNHSCKEVDAAVEYILSAQKTPGNWERWAIYYGGPKKLSAWGSEELTTALCLEALYRFRNATAQAT